MRETWQVCAMCATRYQNQQANFYPLLYCDRIITSHTHTDTHTHLFAVANLLVGYPVHTQRDYRHENGPEQLWTIRLKVQHCQLPYNINILQVTRTQNQFNTVNPQYKAQCISATGRRRSLLPAGTDQWDFISSRRLVTCCYIRLHVKCPAEPL